MPQVQALGHRRQVLGQCHHLVRGLRQKVRLEMQVLRWCHWWWHLSCSKNLSKWIGLARCCSSYLLRNLVARRA